MNFQFSEIFSLFGGFLGIILSLVILFVMRGRITIKITSASALVVSSQIVIIGSMLYSGKIAHFPFLLRVDSPIHYLLGPSFYFYCLSEIRPDFRFRPAHLIHLLPFLVNFIEFVPFYFSTDANKLLYYQNYLDAGTVVIRVHYLLKTISISAYFLVQVFLIIQNRSYLQLQFFFFRRFCMVIFLRRGRKLRNIIGQVFPIPKSKGYLGYGKIISPDLRSPILTRA